MKCNEIVRKVMKDEGMTYEMMKDVLNYKTVSGVSERLRGNMTIDTLLKMLGALGYDVVIRRRKAIIKEDGGRDVAEIPEYTVTN